MSNKKQPVKKAAKLKTKPELKEKSDNKEKTSWIKYEISSLVLFMISVFIYLCVRKFYGLPEDSLFIGLLGMYISKGLTALLGDGAIISSFFLLFWSIHIGLNKKIWSGQMWGLSILALVFLITKSIISIPEGLTELEAGMKGMGGGLIGSGLTYSLMKLLGKVGLMILMVLSTLIACIMIINKSFAQTTGIIAAIAARALHYLNKLLFYEEKEEREPIDRSTPLIIDNIEKAPINETEDNEADEPLTIIAVEEDIEKINKKKSEMKFVLPAVNKTSAYQIPPLELLSSASDERNIDKKNIKESIGVLEDTFSSFGISVKVKQVSCGPAVTRYELSPAPGVKISKIISLTDDLQLNLAAPGIRIEAPIPGKSAIGIEVPNSKILSVGLRNLLSAAAFKKISSPLSFALGEDISGNPVVAKLNDMPHLLIAGSTGSGKSVCLNSIIISILYNTSPDELKLVFIDPKMVELTVYNGIPHLLTPVVTDPKKASIILKWMVNEMEKRYKMFAEKGVRDINRYNQITDEIMPYIVIIIDELADLMMVSPVEVEDSICRLAQMSRAAGMHLIVATQRPSVDVVTGIIKANIPSRIAFAVSSQADSRTILDIGGAEKLLGKGDMLFFPVGAVKPYRVQGAYVSDNDIEKTVEFIKSQVDQEKAVQQDEEMDIFFEQAEIEYDDDLFWEAVTVFVENQKASVSLLQRRLRIGYARAARLVDLMEDRGIVSELEGNKREILIDHNQLAKLTANINRF
ncbi:MAG: DNA translocase FtsK [Syntrophomonadaceae bacterium]|nr:DNA translocase FtsK [Syntrophomonadaceae bacterium]